MGASSGEVWVLADDRSLLFSTHSLETAVAESISIKVALLNRGTGTREMLTRSEDSAGFASHCSGLGLSYIRCESEGDVEDAMRAARTVDDRPTVIDLILACDIPCSPLHACQNVDSSKSIPRVRILR